MNEAPGFVVWTRFDEHPTATVYYLTSARTLHSSPRAAEVFASRDEACEAKSAFAQANPGCPILSIAKKE